MKTYEVKKKGRMGKRGTKKQHSSGKWAWKCIICEKRIPILQYGDDRKGLMPVFLGAGTVDIDFGYGSQFDNSEDVRIQACICDDCCEKRQNLIRMVKTQLTKSWTVVKMPLFHSENPKPGGIR